MLAQLFLVRHGQTAWSVSGQHTSRTDIPLTPEGEWGAQRLAGPLRGLRLTATFASPRLRARQTCELAGLGGAMAIEPDLAEWEYGEYEGLRSGEILARRPGWNLFRDGCPGGESPAQVTARADRLIARLRGLGGNIALFSHGHFSRVLAARWSDLPILAGQRLGLDPASLSILGYEHHDPASPVIALWNARGDREMVGAARA